MPSPPLKPRPRLARWLFDRDIDYRQAARTLGSSHETIRLVCLPFADEKRRVPNRTLMDAIFAWTEGEVRAVDFYPDQLPEAAEGTPGGMPNWARAH